MGLPPCHRDFQCYVSTDHYLDLLVAIRSWDTALGAPFNIAQYALLAHLLETVVELLQMRLGAADAFVPALAFLVERRATAVAQLRRQRTRVRRYQGRGFNRMRRAA